MDSDFSELQIKTLSNLLQREFAKQETGLLKKVELMIAETLQPMKTDVANVKSETQRMKTRILQMEHKEQLCGDPQLSQGPAI